MKRQSLIVTSAVVFTLSGCNGAKPSLPEPAEERITETFQLRGFGAVSAQARAWDVAGGRVSLVRFSTESDEKARIVASKYVTDLEDYSVSSEPAGPHPWQGWTREIADAGLWVVGVEGADVFVLSGPDRESLRPFAQALGAEKWSVPQAGGFPRYLGNFDHEALSFWYNNPCPSSEALEWASRQGAAMNIINSTTEDGYAPGVHDLAGMEQLAAIGKRLDRPHRVMLYATTGCNREATRSISTPYGIPV